jgi:hypothetical protein
VLDFNDFRSVGKSGIDFVLLVAFPLPEIAENLRAIWLF